MVGKHPKTQEGLFSHKLTYNLTSFLQPVENEHRAALKKN